MALYTYLQKTNHGQALIQTMTGLGNDAIPANFTSEDH